MKRKEINLDSRANIDHDSFRRSVACFPSTCMINSLNRMTFPKFDFIWPIDRGANNLHKEPFDEKPEMFPIPEL